MVNFCKPYMSANSSPLYWNGNWPHKFYIFSLSPLKTVLSCAVPEIKPVSVGFVYVSVYDCVCSFYFKFLPTLPNYFNKWFGGLQSFFILLQIIKITCFVSLRYLNCARTESQKGMFSLSRLVCDWRSLFLWLGMLLRPCWPTRVLTFNTYKFHYSFGFDHFVLQIYFCNFDFLL